MVSSSATTSDRDLSPHVYRTFGPTSDTSSLTCQNSRNKGGAERAAMFWVLWNRMIEKNSEGHPYLLHRVEDKMTPELSLFIKCQHCEEPFEDTKANSWKLRTEGLHTGRPVPAVSFSGHRVGTEVRVFYAVIMSV
jgi:hypothetical protein